MDIKKGEKVYLKDKKVFAIYNDIDKTESDFVNVEVIQNNEYRESYKVKKDNIGKNTGYKDIRGKFIYVGMKCKDIIYDVDNITIIEKNNIFYAKPNEEGLSEEPLLNVLDGILILD